MKKWLMGLASLILVMGIGTSVYAATAADSSGSIDRMLPFMKQMHPNWTDHQLQDMANTCHSGNSRGMQSMMGNSDFHRSMMNFD